MEWSKYNLDIFKNIESGSGHTIIEARAGSGKTTCATEGLNYLDKSKSWLLCAFNKIIADEMKERAPKTGEIKTLHAFGLKTLYKRYPKLQVDQDKLLKILNKILGKKGLWDEKIALIKCVSLCKGHLVEGAEFIDFIMDKFDIEPFSFEREDFINKVKTLITLSREDTKTIDFDDMIYLPYALNIPTPRYHAVFVDEAQDLNLAQIQMVLKAVKRNGRIFATGDTYQSIYSFRGADSNAIQRFDDELKATKLLLPITYRCPLLVVQEAQKYVSDIEPRPNAPVGIVDNISFGQMMKMAQPGCFILSRTNAPMVPIALRFLKNNIPTTIQGRDIGANLLSLIKKSRKKDISSFLNWIDKWESNEVIRLQKKRQSTEVVTDKAACLKALSEGAYNIEDLKSKIKSLFEDTDDRNRIILSTCHRAKGLERPIVFILQKTFWGEENAQEEKNVKYVAITRSAAELYYVG